MANAATAASNYAEAFLEACYLRPLHHALQLHCFESLSSTMDAARTFVESGSLPEATTLTLGPAADLKDTSPRVILSHRQTAGRGREGRVWESAADSGLYLTFLSYTDLPEQHFSGFSLATGIALSRALQEFDVAAKLKWPNDVLVQSPKTNSYNKLAGVLVELFPAGERGKALSVGIGINLRADAAVSAVGGISLAELLENAPDPATLFVELLHSYFEIYEKYLQTGFGAFAEEWQQRAMMIGALVRTADGAEGRVCGIDERGGLRLEDPVSGAALDTVYSGEVNFADALSL